MMVTGGARHSNEVTVIVAVVVAAARLIVALAKLRAAQQDLYAAGGSGRRGTDDAAAGPGTAGRCGGRAGDQGRDVARAGYRSACRAGAEAGFRARRRVDGSALDHLSHPDNGVILCASGTSGAPPTRTSRQDRAYVEVRVGIRFRVPHRCARPTPVPPDHRLRRSGQIPACCGRELDRWAPRW